MSSKYTHWLWRDGARGGDERGVEFKGNTKEMTVEGIISDTKVAIIRCRSKFDEETAAQEIGLLLDNAASTIRQIQYVNMLFFGAPEHLARAEAIAKTERIMMTFAERKGNDEDGELRV